MAGGIIVWPASILMDLTYDLHLRIGVHINLSGKSKAWVSSNYIRDSLSDSISGQWWWDDGRCFFCFFFLDIQAYKTAMPFFWSDLSWEWQEESVPFWSSMRNRPFSIFYIYYLTTRLTEWNATHILTCYKMGKSPI